MKNMKINKSIHGKIKATNILTKWSSTLNNSIENL